jgi:tripeptide aminopeptidase
MTLFSPEPTMNRQRLLENFLRYVQVDTTAREGTDTYPSSPGQLVLGKLLVEQLLAMGIEDAKQDEHGIVLATVPATVPEAPAIAWCAHLDTSPETTGAGVKPQVIERYAGGDIPLPGVPGLAVREADNPELGAMRGHTLITSDGTTLLGADDKAGVAAIVEAAQWLMEHPELPRGPIRLCFTCDEEIGHGVDHLHPDRVDATAAYTLDGQGADTVDVETFSADLARVKIYGVNIHPSIGKGRMVNSLRAAGDFLARLPRTTLAPEATDEREGFLHPYHMVGSVGEAEIQILLRDFQTAELARYAGLLRTVAEATMAQFPGLRIEVLIDEQYRNMAEGLAKEPRAVAFAEDALRSLGRTPRRTIVRGGTDGSRLTELGLPTPNLATGEHTPHSRLEWASLDEMVAAAQWLVALAERWSRA